MRQVLPTKPLTTAIRYGPGFLSHCMYLVWVDQGLKQAGSAPGPGTTFGAARAATLDNRKPARASAGTRMATAIDFLPTLMFRLSAGAGLCRLPPVSMLVPLSPVSQG